MLWKGKGFSLSQTLECGQCFRYHKEDERYTVIAGHRAAVLGQEGDSILFYEGKEEDVPFWHHYFDWDREYEAIKKRLVEKDAVMREAIGFCGGIHILNQDFFEMLISFILSQNNNIKRIQGMTERLCRAYGTEMENFFAFPTAEQLASVTEADYRALGFGFRARYAEDAVRCVLNGGYSREELEGLSTEKLRERLMKICGVGQKVADCIMLFSLGRYEVFPADVWIKRIMSEVYFGGKEISPKTLQEEAKKRFGKDAGFAQQYLFHYGRCAKTGK